MILIIIELLAAITLAVIISSKYHYRILEGKELMSNFRGIVLLLMVLHICVQVAYIFTNGLKYEFQLSSHLLIT